MKRGKPEGNEGDGRGGLVVASRGRLAVGRVKQPYTCKRIVFIMVMGQHFNDQTEG